MKVLFLLVLSLLFFGRAGFGEDADQVQIGFLESAPWDVVNGGYYGTYRVAPPAGAQSPKKSVTWRVNIPTPNKTHIIQTTWTADPSNARNAKFSIFDGKRFLRSVTVNQQKAPLGEKDGSATFQDLGSFLITGGPIQVDLTNEADGRVIADTIRVK